MTSSTPARAPLPYQWHGPPGDPSAPLVLVAGLGGKGTSWRPFLEVASARFRTLTMDLPGSGEGPEIAGPTSIRELAAQLLALLDHLELERVRLVGRSMGGMIAQELALAAPGRIERLVLVSTSARVDPHLAEVFRLWARMAELDAPAEIRHRSAMLWCLGRAALADDARVRAYLRAKSLVDRPLEYALQSRACAVHDALERLPALRVPTLVVSGTDDRLTPRIHAETLAKAIPGAELVAIPEAGHLPYLETPEAFARAVMEFLEREPAGEGS